MSTKIMAIINTSTDSFSGDGIAAGDQDALKQHIQKALDQGADMLDIGGQSTRPGAVIIDVDEEIQRVIPAITLARQLTDLPISVDTFKPAVAEAALKAGATIVNDITGCTDPKMIEVVKNSGCKVVIMHMRGTPETMSTLTNYSEGVVKAAKTFLFDQAEKLVEAGVAKDNIILDPGIGFAKTAEQSFELTRHIQEFTNEGYPILYGASNKSFLGKALATDRTPVPVEDRVVATVVVQSLAMLSGVSIVRVHDVEPAIQTRIITEAILGTRKINL